MHLNSKQRHRFLMLIVAILLATASASGCGRQPQAAPAPYSSDDEESGTSSSSSSAESTEEEDDDEVSRSGELRSLSGSARPGDTPAPSAATSSPSAATPLTSPSPTAAAVKQATKVKGIYVSAANMKGSAYRGLVKLVEQTDLNALVIDVKNDSGQVTYSSSVPAVREIGADAKRLIPDLPAKLQELKAKQIYTIARVVVFKDPYLAAKKPAYAMQKKSGGVWRDPKGVSWVDPYQPKVWDYAIGVAEEAARMGFDEIQFDYVRFPDNGERVSREVAFQNPNGYTKQQAIQQFLTQARTRLPNTTLSADVFGLTTSSKDDMGIGQKWEAMAPQVDVMSPMIYPSHYSKGMYGITSPDLKPYTLISKALQDANTTNKTSAKPARIRPWLQDFTATWVEPHQTYGLKQVKEQIQAAADQGIDEFLLWNPSNKYSYR